MAAHNPPSDKTIKAALLLSPLLLLRPGDLRHMEWA